MLMTIPSIQTNFHSPVDPPHQSKSQNQNPQSLYYTAEMAAKAVEPTVWTCGKAGKQKGDILDPITNQRPFFAFVHVYKTGGSSIRKFFKEYATICKKSLALIEGCNYRKARADIEGCQLTDSRNAPHGIDSVSSTILHDHYDILGGHFSFGMADDIFFPNAVATPNDDSGDAPSQVRHMVFLRQPMTKFVSHVLYQQKKGNEDKTTTLEETVKGIKKRVRRFRKDGEYMGSLNFPQAPVVFRQLLTPTQLKMANRLNQTAEEVMAIKTQLAIENLMKYNAIIGITEMVPQSLKIFEHALGQIVSSASKKEEVQDFFSRYTGEDVPKANGSSRGDISTGSVLKELEKDEEFIVIFREFVKYEEMLYDVAMHMHEKQYEAAKKGHFELSVLKSLDESKARLMFFVCSSVLKYVV